MTPTPNDPTTALPDRSPVVTPGRMKRVAKEDMRK